MVTVRTSAPAVPFEHDRAIRRAALSDADTLFSIRRDAIRVIASRGMPEDAARRWADARTPEWIVGILHSRNVWVFELDGRAVGWISVTNDTIDGLYTSPQHEQRGVGSRLLACAEAEMSRRGVSGARLESSLNAEGFYIRRGYKPDGPRTSDGTLRMRKPLDKVSMEPTPSMQIELVPCSADDQDFAFRVTEATMRAYVEQAFGAWDSDAQRRRLNEAFAMETWSLIVVDGVQAGVLAVHERATEIFLSAIFLLPEFQRQGIGSTLTKQLIDRAQVEAKPLRLRVLRVNPARRLYERLGFVVTASTAERFYMEYRC